MRKEATELHMRGAACLKAGRTLPKELGEYESLSKQMRTVDWYKLAHLSTTILLQCSLPLGCTGSVV
jgi:hypothetical protein